MWPALDENQQVKMSIIHTLKPREQHSTRNPPGRDAAVRGRNTATDKESSVSQSLRCSGPTRTCSVMLFCTDAQRGGVTRASLCLRCERVVLSFSCFFLLFARGTRDGPSEMQTAAQPRPTMGPRLRPRDLCEHSGVDLHPIAPEKSTTEDRTETTTRMGRWC